MTINEFGETIVRNLLVCKDSLIIYVQFATFTI